MIYVWLSSLVVFIIIELATVNLVTIWFAVGSLAALIAALLSAGPVTQAVLFFAVSSVVLLCLRPFVKKFMHIRQQPTNADRVIGKICTVIAEIDNVSGTGSVSVGGKIWTARSENGEEIPAGTIVKAVRIDGVKLIVVPAEEAVHAK